MSNSRTQLLVLVALGALLFFLNTWGYDLWPADEPRFGEIPREMMQSGNYLAPYCNGEPYKEKPPLLFWTIAAASLPFGDVTEFSARFPSGLAALGTVLLTYLIARKLFGTKAGFWSALVLMTMAFFWTEARSVRCDMLLTFWMTLAWYAMMRFEDEKQPRWLILLYAAIALGLYTKGPVALVFPVLFIIAFYWRRSDERRALHWFIGILAAMALVLVWYIPARMILPPTPQTPETASVGRELFHQIIGRLVLGVSKAEPPWYYLYNVPPGMLPWMLFLPWTLLYAWRHRRDGGAMRSVLCWLVPAFLFFTISTGKRHVYVLPIYPALAILTAQSVLDLAESDRIRWRKWTAAVWALTLIGIGAGPFFMLKTEYREAWNPLFAVFSVCAFGFAAATLWRALRTEVRTLHASMAAHFIVLAVLAATLFYPALDPYKGASDFCKPIRELSLRKTDFNLYSVAFSREEYVFYARHFHKRALMDDIHVALQHPVNAKIERKYQDALFGAIQKGLHEAGFTNPVAVTGDQIRAAQIAVDKAIQESGVDPQYVAAFLALLRAEVQEFEQGFLQATPAFAFVQKDDWIWILPFLTRPLDATSVAQQSVGQRDMLLLANSSGKALLESQEKDR